MIAGRTASDPPRRDVARRRINWALIQARIAQGLSQKDLARRLGLKEQQIQRYEATDYASASLARLIRVGRALHLKVSAKAWTGNGIRSGRSRDTL